MIDKNNQVDLLYRPQNPYSFPGQGCPNCGYCPHCGRGGNYYPYYPTWTLSQNEQYSNPTEMFGTLGGGEPRPLTCKGNTGNFDNDVKYNSNVSCTALPNASYDECTECTESYDGKYTL